jgi:hypothetical protein
MKSTPAKGTGDNIADLGDLEISGFSQITKITKSQNFRFGRFSQLQDQYWPSRCSQTY